MNANVYRTPGVRFVDPPEPWQARLASWARARCHGLAATGWFVLRFVLFLPVIVLFVSLRMSVTLVRVLVGLCMLPIVVAHSALSGRRIELVVNL